MVDKTMRVSSLEQSSTTMSSKSEYDCRSTLSIAARIVRARLKVGIMTETLGCMEIILQQKNDASIDELWTLTARAVSHTYWR
jgi:hypothetical protein